MAKIIDGKKIAEDVKSKLQTEIETLVKKGITPCLGVLLIGDNPASHVYVGMKEKACAKLGVISKTMRLDKNVTKEEVIRHIDELNNDKKVNGILVQLPLPNQLDENEILMRIDPMKDVDGIHPMSFGRLLAGDPTFIPCTPHGILKILEYEGIDTEGKHAVVVGRSIIVGKPIAVLLSRKAKGGNATVTVCHTRTKNLSEFTRQADILIAAMGVPEAITGDMIKEGAVVIDVGTNRVDDPAAKKGYRLVGDVEFETAEKKASLISPVPGGVGPLTIAMLMENTVTAAKLQNAL